MDTFIVFAANYDTQGAAEADYHAVRELYLEPGLIDTYDAAVITRDDAGKVSIVAKHEQPTPRGAWRGLGIGLAVSALPGEGQCGLVVAAAGDLADRVERAIGHARGLTRRQLTIDETVLERDLDAAAPSPVRDPDESYRQAVAQAEAAVREAEAAAAAAEQEAKGYSTFRLPGDSGTGGAGGFTG